MSSREIAIIILLIPALLYCVSVKTIRDSLIVLLKQLFLTELIFILLIPVIFVLLVNLAIDDDSVKILICKISVLWVCFNAIPSIINYKKIISGEISMVSQVLNHLKFSTIIIILVNATNRSILLEVVMILISTITLLVIEYMKVNDEYKDKKYDSLKSVMQYVVIGTAAYLLYGTVQGIITELNNYFNVITLMKIILPFIYSSLFIPVFFTITSVILIEEQIVNNKFIVSNDEHLLRYLNRQTVLKFMFSPEKLSRLNQRLRQNSSISRDTIRNDINTVLEESD